MSKKQSIQYEQARNFVFVLNVLVLAVAWIGIEYAHRLYNSWWLDIYIWFIVWQLFTALQGVAEGLQGYKNFFRVLLSVTISVVITTLVYQNLTKDWLRACLAGVLIFIILSIARNWQILPVQTKLQEVQQAQKAGNLAQALILAQEARSLAIARKSLEGQALSEYFLGILYNQTGDYSTAILLLKNALNLFCWLGKNKEAKQVSQFLHDMGENVPVSNASVEAFIDWKFLLDCAFSVTLLLGLSQLWQIQAFQASLAVLVTSGILLFLLIYGNYGILALATAHWRDQRRRWKPLLIYNLALALLAFGCVSLMLKQGAFQVNDFPSAFQESLSGFSSTIAGWPFWTLPSVVLFSVLSLLEAGMTARGHSLRSLLGQALEDFKREKTVVIQEIPAHYCCNISWLFRVPECHRIEILYYTDISCPRQIWEKTPRISAVVRLKINPPEYSDAPVEELPVRFVKEKLSEEDEQPRLESPVRVRVDAPAFTVLNEPEQEVVIQPGADSFPLVFDLQPLSQLGPTHINFDFFQGGNPLGTASLAVEITPTEVSSKLEASLRSQLRSPNAQSPDLILQVKYEPSPNQPLALRFTLFRDGGFGRDFLPVPLNGDPQSYTASLYRGLENLTRAVAGRMVAKEDRQQGVRLKDIDRGLQKLGYRLWNDLIPKEFKELYAEHRESWHSKTLVLISDEPYIPWELVWPYDEGNQWRDEAPWCVTMRLTRWLRRDAQGNGNEMAPGLLHLNKLACIAPEQSKLEYALQERQFLQEQISRYHLRDVSPAACRLLEIEELLESSEYDWLHIATHGDFDTDTPDDPSAIFLDNHEKLTVNDLLGPQIQAHIKNSHPAFFFNACHSGRQAWALTGLGGWPNRLVSAGAGLFLAPLWKVSDDLALEFAKTFYEELLGGNTVAEAMCSARNKARREGDPTWLAYSVYAHPNGRLGYFNS
jgi:tetratricopeptide (TPR) repeat protein